MKRRILLIFMLIISIFSLVACGDEDDEFEVQSINESIISSGILEYETSLTNSINNKKAEVYKSNLSVDETVKEIEKIREPIGKEILLSGKVILLNYYDEEILVYEGEEGATYIQVSNEEYLDGGGYKAVHRPGKFFRTYGVVSAVNDASKVFKNKRSTMRSSNSVRNSSTGTRKSTGGGTSFGK